MTSPMIRVCSLTLGYGDRTVLKNISFDVAAGAVFAIIGPSGCGKSTLLRAMSGLIPPHSGRVVINGKNLTSASDTECCDIMRDVGVLFQGAALFTSLTVSENIAMPLVWNSGGAVPGIDDIVAEKLALVGLPDAGDLYPAQLSGGMKKRVGLARALARNPRILYLDEPSAGLDPVSAGRLDSLILNINRTLGTTIVMVSHDLDSIFAVANDCIYLSPDAHGITARGRPHDLLRHAPDAAVLNFLTRGKK